ncbi:MAG: hypothetical protein ACLGHP_07015, partial [Vicinamibacteria bacterium]
IAALTLATANIHLGLGGLLFTLNGLGYLGLAVLLVIGAAILYQNREVLLPQSASEPAATVGHLATGVTP